MEINEEQVEQILSNELAPTAHNESEIIPKLEAIAALKGLEVYLFKENALKVYFSNVNPELGIALMAKSEESARWNLQNLRKCYLVKLEPKNIIG